MFQSTKIGWGSSQTFGRRDFSNSNKTECTCNRPHATILCHACGYIATGRVTRNCRQHSNVKYLMDFGECPKCKAHPNSMEEFELAKSPVKTESALPMNVEESSAPRIVKSQLTGNEVQMDSTDVLPPARPPVKQRSQKVLNPCVPNAQMVRNQFHHSAQLVRNPFYVPAPGATAEAQCKGRPKIGQGPPVGPAQSGRTWLPSPMAPNQPPAGRGNKRPHPEA